MLRFFAAVFLGIIVCQGTVLNRNRRVGTAHNWCCNVPVDPVIRNVTTTSLEPKNVTRVVNTTYERTCEFGEQPTSADGWKCADTVTHVITTTEMVETTKTVQIEYPGRCPQEHLDCCQGYMKVGNQCLDQDSSGALQELLNAGLLG
ncbi:uncharacterized protein LOC111119936 [Crassostrea virginica]|uniref:Uncharacterized protein LOC111119936 n=1 Tax=Crassostrea virginica TaxID=6565 RepID=A0A8B8CKE2_CRAVI|nr:uncharacterized protein LOC111119936 [Crassostrea virginica]